MALSSLHDLFIDEIKDLYSAEKQLVKALPKMAKAAQNSELKQGIEAHLEETTKQVERLQQIFERLDIAVRAKHCNAMEGLVEEGSEVIEEKDADPAVRDAALIAAAQKVEHYEIAGYGSAKAHALLLGLNDIADLLNETLDEEKAADEKLGFLAVNTINEEAVTSDERSSVGGKKSQRSERGRDSKTVHSH